MENQVSPKLSIVIPIYNVEKYVKACLTSILANRSSSFDIEIILVDDGSTDHSGNICDAYSRRYEFIKTIHQTNKGLAVARNAGINYATGKWITFIDSDDEVEKDYLNIIFDLIKLNQDIVLFKYKTMVYDNRKATRNTANNTVSHAKSISKSKAMYYLTTEEWGNFAWNKLYKRKLFKTIKYPADKNFEDIATTFKLFEKASSIMICNNAIYMYRIRANSITNSTNSVNRLKNIKDSIEARKHQIDFFKKNNYIKAARNANCYLLSTYFSYINAVKVNRLKEDKTYKKCITLIKRQKINFKTVGISKVALRLYIKVKILNNTPNLYFNILSIKNAHRLQ
ncbi:glycosyltransferase family 2 protein [Lactobacillus helveticus]|uniref:glycosyltransferase family 2 protein n=1 Tax=Lactobacillus helveticus TaxID=1587 RepID=UPI001563A79B|nr:glycosyltransferase [Lactobacillus helveticus]NRO18923.1 putative glycosyltransferase EpsJ [Lactobacillus helveticus]